MAPSSQIPFRNILPSRNVPSRSKKYRRCKMELREDFNRKCGYCDDFEYWAAGGDKNFHIDHFVPQRYGIKVHDYNNLVYSCPYCNLAKKRDWPTDDPAVTVSGYRGYIDPCDALYDSSFCRNSHGKIIPKTDLAKYMYQKLKLSLLRHSIIWKIEKYEHLINNIKEKLKTCDKSFQARLKNKLLTLFLKKEECIDYLKNA